MSDQSVVLLEGSCHCGSVRFRVESSTPYPYQACYCSICRKTAGGGGYAINLGADASTLEVEGRENLSVYNAKLYDRGEGGEAQVSEAERNFGKHCGRFPLTLFSEPSGAAPSVRLGHRHATPEAAGARAPHAELRSAVVRDPRNRQRTALPRVPGRVPGGVAPPPRSGRVSVWGRSTYTTSNVWRANASTPAPGPTTRAAPTSCGRGSYRSRLCW